MKVFRIYILVILLTLFSAAQSQASGPYVVNSSSHSFEDVLETLKMAIEERGLFINNIMHLGEMMERTGKDLGYDKPVLLKAESVEFCSAVLSRKMIKENPARVVNCPFVIAVYVLPEEPDKTYVAYRNVKLGDDGDALCEVDEMLSDLAKAAVEGW